MWKWEDDGVHGDGPVQTGGPWRHDNTTEGFRSVKVPSAVS